MKTIRKTNYFIHQKDWTGQEHISLKDGVKITKQNYKKILKESIAYGYALDNKLLTEILLLK